VSADANVNTGASASAPTEASADAARLAHELAGLVGSAVWSTKLGIGSHLTVDLGDRMEQRLEIRGKEYVGVVGEWRLWIQLAAWRVQGPAEVLLGSEDPRPFIAEKITVLRGRRITAVEVTAPASETVFDFGGIRLLVFPVNSALSVQPETSVHPQWSLWRPQGDVVSVGPGPGRTWVAQPSRARTVKLDPPAEPDNPDGPGQAPV
jgi:hypothetical protein